MFLFIWFLRAAHATNVTGVIGKSVELRCLCCGTEPFSLNKFRVIWQNHPPTRLCHIDAYYPVENTKHEESKCEEFKNRTLFNEQLKKGDFSLRLLDISLKDESTYECVVQRNVAGIYNIFSRSIVNLKVAAHYSQPVITDRVQSGEEILFICNSSHGYPLQKLKWINQTDSSILNATEWSVANPDGTFSVSSTLRIKATPDTKLGCRIENPLLHQNITIDIDNPANLSRISGSHHRNHIIPCVMIAGFVIILIIFRL